ncbi:MAG: glycosyltransferase [Gemmatimonadaceae bacterium]|nr:glycosyltransferase [Gemmatimonadaceae bacterium]
MSASPRVLFVTHNFPRTAGDPAGSFILRLADALGNAGARIDVIAPGAPGLASRDVVQGIPVQRVRYARDDRQTLAYEGTMVEAVRAGWSGRFALLGLLWHTRRAVQQAITAARREGAPYDAVHAHWWFPAGLCTWAAGLGRPGGPRFIVTMHGSDVRLAQGVSAAHPIMRAVLHRAQAVTAVSHWLADTAASIVPGCDIHVAPMPVNVHGFTPGPRDRGGVLFVGRLNAQKGVGQLLAALARTASHLTCDIVGDGPDRAALHAQANTLGLASRVRWHGALPHDALPALYQRALVTVMPSHEEGLGLVAVESALCSTPVIAYRSGGLPDVVVPSHGGTLIEPGDIDALAAAIDAAARDLNATRTRGEMARAHALEHFDPAHVAARYLALYASPERPDEDLAASARQ